MPTETNKFDWNKNRPKNYVELTEAKKIEAELDAIHTKLSEGKITIENAKFELKKINDWLQKKNIDQWYKEKISNAFDKLTSNLDKNIKNLNAEKAKAEFENEKNGIVNLVHQSTNKQLARLKRSVQHPTPERPKEVQKWINESSENLVATVNNAAKDDNILARTIWKRMEKLIS